MRRATGGEKLADAPSRGLHWQKRRVAELEPAWGRELDRLGASMRQIRWVASPGPRERLAEVERRYRALVAFLEGKSEHQSFTALCDAFPTFDPVTGEELAAAAPPAGTSLAPPA